MFIRESPQIRGTILGVPPFGETTGISKKDETFGGPENKDHHILKSMLRRGRLMLGMKGLESSTLEWVRRLNHDGFSGKCRVSIFIGYHVWGNTPAHRDRFFCADILSPGPPSKPHGMILTVIP